MRGSIIELHRAGGTKTVGNELLPLLCPDWRTATLVIDAEDATVAFANSPCIDMLRRKRPARLVRGCLAFDSPDLDRRFHIELSQLLSTGRESAFLFERDIACDTWLSVSIRNGQGFFRDAIHSGLGAAYGPSLMVVELATAQEDLDRAAFTSFAKTACLSKAEAELVHLVATGNSLQKAAEIRGVAISTIRQRMKAILQKTGCRNQSELIHLVLSLCPRRLNQWTA
jgi:DNA-binding CsgD family transcriptional regulator